MAPFKREDVAQRPKAAAPRALCKHPYDCRARRPAINQAKSIHFECHPFPKQTSPVSGADDVSTTPLSTTMLCNPQNRSCPCPQVTGENQPNRMKIK